jgi:hypothetical protein
VTWVTQNREGESYVDRDRFRRADPRQRLHRDAAWRVVVVQHGVRGNAPDQGSGGEEQRK